MIQHDRRNYPRLPVNVELSWEEVVEKQGSRETAQTKDVSEGGVCIVLSYAYPLDSLLDVTLILPDSYKSLRAQAKVVWTDEVRVGKETSYDTGLKFVRLDPEQQARIKKTGVRFDVEEEP